ncbi:hypothetical protein D3C86_2081770 [compost metagenome]
MHRLQRDIHDLGDLLVVELVIVAKIHHLLLAWRQLRERTAKCARAALFALSVDEFAFGGNGKKPVLKGGNFRPGTGYASV